MREIWLPIGGVNVAIASATVGFLGALCWFCAGVLRGRIRNNEYFRKITLEIIGGATTAPFVVLAIRLPLDGPPNITIVLLASFATGTCWSGLIQILREWITRVVKAALGDTNDP